MHDLDTAVLRTFVVLAETRSFSKTAIRVGRSQSAISAQIKKLEDLTGATLFVRDTRRVALTPDGERLLGYAAGIVSSADAMMRRARSTDIAGEVRFASPEDFASAYLPAVLSAFAEAHPRVRLTVTCDLTLRLIAQFEAGEQDLVVVKQDPDDRYPGAKPLWLETLVWVAASPPNMPLPLDFAEACADARRKGRPLPLIVSPAPCVYRQRAVAALDAVEQPWSAVYVSPSHAGCAAAVKAGLGYAVMPSALTPQSLTRLGPDRGWPRLPAAEMCLLPSPKLSPAAAALSEFIKDRCPGERTGGRRRTSLTLR